MHVESYVCPGNLDWPQYSTAVLGMFLHRLSLAEIASKMSDIP